MASSVLLFESQFGEWCVYSCACGCDSAVKIEEIAFRYFAPHEIANPRYYITGHQPLSCDWRRVGAVYTWEAGAFISHEFDEDQPADTDVRRTVIK